MKRGHDGLHKAQTMEERRKGKARRSSSLILDLKDDKLQDAGKQEEGMTVHKLLVLGINDNLWDNVCGLGSKTWKGCE